MSFNGLNMHLGNIMKLSKAETRSISAENVYGEKGAGGMAELTAKPQAEVERIGQQWVGPNPQALDLGRTWKVRPCINIPKESTATIMDIDGPGAVQHIWITMAAKWYRNLILRMYWDDETTPSVEVPLGDFFCNGWKARTNILSIPINVNPSGGFNCFFPMPFRKHARVTIENIAAEDALDFFYTFNLAMTEVEPEDAYFHAQFRKTNPVPYKQVHTILDNIHGAGQYVGTYLAWQQNSAGWWGEGEFKVYLDGDTEFPTICGTGTEDYFGGAWSFGSTYSAPFMGYPQGASDGKPGNRHGLYRFHVMDPIRFQQDLRVDIQALGLRSGDRYLPLRDDISSVAYWYQTEPHGAFPKLPDRDTLEII